MISTDPTIEQLKEIALSVQGLSIQGVDDKLGFDAVRENRIKLKNIRVEITKQCKALRDPAIKYQKDVIEYEKGLISIIEPAELKLELMEDNIKEMQEIEKRKKILPERMKEIERCGLPERDEEKILRMSSDEFNARLVTERERIVKEKEDALAKKEYDAKLSIRRSRLIDAGNTGMSDDYMMGYTDEEFEERLKEEVEIRNDMKRKAEEKAKIDLENAEIERKENEERIAKEEKEKEEKSKKYKKRLLDNSYNDQDFFIASEGNKRTMYKKVSELFI